ncbi:MAG: rod shape-determining protein MreD [Dehalococcoidia bacterium]|nr:rod shape-determining protein MreD [Dehalococcoidia bacterium]
MSYLIAIVIAWFLALLNASALPYVQVLGVTPDLVLIFAVCWAMVRGQDEALFVVPLAGFLRDLNTSDPLGTSVLAMAPVVLLAAAIRLRALDTEFVPTIAVVAGGSLAYGVISMMVLAATGQDIQWLDALLTVTLPGMLVNALFTPILYLPVHWLGHRRREGLQGAGRLTSPL